MVVKGQGSYYEVPSVCGHLERVAAIIVVIIIIAIVSSLTEWSVV